VNNNVVVDELAEEILNSFPKIYYPFRRLLGKYSEFQVTTLQILKLYQRNWFLRKRLYKELELSPEVVSGRIIPPLIRDKLIESTREVPPCPDRRTSMDRITPGGEKFLENALSSRKQFIKELLKLMSEEHREVVVSLLRKFNKEITTEKLSVVLKRASLKMR
jgi:DNA-binding MarR family transcriptional regulator